MFEHQIIIDFSQIAIRATASLVKINQALTIDDMRQPIFMAISKIKQHFKDNQDIVLAIDHPHTWRRDFFPYYKAKRKTKRAEDTFDWQSFYKELQRFIEELKEYSPYKVIQVEGCEGDDVIAVLAMDRMKEPYYRTTIVSSDKDFFQLHCPTVRQFCPAKWEHISKTDDILPLNEHILKGDYADGIPNINSSDDTYVSETAKTKRFVKAEYDRMKQLTVDQLHQELSDNPNWIRNRTLIDFTYIPELLRTKVRGQLSQPSSNLKWRRYLIEHQMLS